MEQNKKASGLEITGMHEDAEGKYYSVVLLNTEKMNASGVQYTGDIKHLIRGIKRQPRVFCEVDPYHDYRFNISFQEDRYASAVCTIDQKNVCAAIENVKHNTVLGQVTGQLRPWGPQAKLVRDLMENRNANVTFGMRALANPKGQVDKIICWDLIPE